MTEDEIQERLRQTCVELKGPKGHLGSGYVIAPDRVGTANHVVRDWSDKDWYDIAVGWGAEYRRKARARVLHRNTESDAALLEVVGVSDLQALPVLNDPPRSGRPWWGFGFPSVAARAGVATGVSDRRNGFGCSLEQRQAGQTTPAPIAGSIDRSRHSAVRILRKSGDRQWSRRRSPG